MANDGLVFSSFGGAEMPLKASLDCFAQLCQRLHRSDLYITFNPFFRFL
jgi:hypothetical protein